jgi:hypothetical protein
VLWLEADADECTDAWLELEPFCFVWPRALADFPCELETLACALAFAAGWAGCPRCF